MLFQITVDCLQTYTKHRKANFGLFGVYFVFQSIGEMFLHLAMKSNEDGFNFEKWVVHYFKWSTVSINFILFPVTLCVNISMIKALIRIGLLGLQLIAFGLQVSKICRGKCWYSKKTTPNMPSALELNTNYYVTGSFTTLHLVRIAGIERNKLYGMATNTTTKGSEFRVWLVFGSSSFFPFSTCNKTKLKCLKFFHCQNIQRTTRKWVNFNDDVGAVMAFVINFLFLTWKLFRP